MAEITLPVVLQIAQTIGILVAVFYYVISIRNQNRARQVQTFTLLHQHISNPDFIRHGSVLLNMEWDDYHDFEMKYGSDVNLESQALRYSNWSWWDGMGHLLKKGLIDGDTMYELTNSGYVSWIWTKFESVIKEIRVRYNMPELGKNFEYLANEHDSMMLKRGHSPGVPKEYGKYIPDQ